MRKALAALAILVLAPATITLAAMPARAATGDLTCTSNAQINFTPPLTATQTTADTTDTAGLAGCTSPNGNFPRLASGTVQASGPATSLGGVPCNLLLTVTGTGTITWNTNQKSKLTFDINTNPTNGTLSFSGAITTGPLNADTITSVPVVANPNPDCAINGLKYLTVHLMVISFG